MRKIILIFFFTVLFFLLEFIIFNLVGRILVPNLLLLLIVFITLAFGIRYGIVTAVFSGILNDSFGSYIFGINLFTFVTCAFATVIFMRHFYSKGSSASRLLLVFIIIVVSQITKTILYLMYGPIDFVQVLFFIFIPEILTTLLITNTVFNFLKKCALKLFAI